MKIVFRYILNLQVERDSAISHYDMDTVFTKYIFPLRYEMHY